MGSVRSKAHPTKAWPVPHRRRYKVVLVSLMLVLGLLLAIAISLSFGSVALTQPEVWAALNRQGSRINQTIIWDLRLPRVLMAIMAAPVFMWLLYRRSGAITRG